MLISIIHFPYIDDKLTIWFLICLKLHKKRLDIHRKQKKIMIRSKETKHIR